MSVKVKLIALAILKIRNVIVAIKDIAAIAKAVGPVEDIADDTYPATVANSARKDEKPTKRK